MEGDDPDAHATSIESPRSSSSEISGGFGVETPPLSLSHTRDYFAPFHVQGTEFESKVVRPRRSISLSKYGTL